MKSIFRYADSRADRPALNETVVRDRETYPDFEVAHASEIDLHLSRLIAIEETDDVFYSIYLDLGEIDVDTKLRRLVSSLAPGLEGDSLYWLFQAESCLLDLIGNRLRDEHRGLAVHFRGGNKPEAYAIAFHLPIRSWACVDRSPNLVPLIEMRDSYDRYVVLISDDRHARILEVVLGSVTREAWFETPSLRGKVGREWAREHYRNENPERENLYLDEKLHLLKDLMSRKGGYSHLILAGSPQRVGQIEQALPEALRRRIVDICDLSVKDPREKIVRETIRSFIEQEAHESRSALERLNALLLSGVGNAVVGLDASESALYQDLIETLVVTRPVNEETGEVRVFRHRAPDGNFLTVEKRRQILLNRSLQKGVRIEFVDRDSFLDDYYGVGAILRHDGGTQG